MKVFDIKQYLSNKGYAKSIIVEELQQILDDDGRSWLINCQGLTPRQCMTKFGTEIFDEWMVEESAFEWYSNKELEDYLRQLLREDARVFDIRACFNSGTDVGRVQTAFFGIERLAKKEEYWKFRCQGFTKAEMKAEGYGVCDEWFVHQNQYRHLSNDECADYLLELIKTGLKPEYKFPLF